MTRFRVMHIPPQRRQGSGRRTPLFQGAPTRSALLCAAVICAEQVTYCMHVTGQNRTSKCVVGHLGGIRYYGMWRVKDVSDRMPSDRLSHTSRLCVWGVWKRDVHYR